MKRKKSLRQWFQYHFDNIMSKGTIALIVLLFTITVAVVFIMGLLALLVGSEGNLPSLIWISLMHALDPGTLTADTLDNIPYIILMSIATLCGIFITSILIGIITTGFEAKLNELRKGKSKVLEEGHTLILGFNDSIYTLLNELIGANENHKNGCIVVVGTQEKEDMEEAIAAQIPDTKTTKIICRSGNLTEPHILERCSVETAKSIIINEYEDAEVIKIILALTSYLKENEPLYPDLYITASIQQEHNIEAAKIAGQERVELIFANDAISRIIAHTCRQPGMSNVLVELFDYDGDELYFEQIPELEGMQFKEILNRFEKAVVFGIANENGPKLNPPMDTVIQKGDAIILLEDDDGSFRLNNTPIEISEELIQNKTPEAIVQKAFPDNLLILEINQKLESILKEYDCYVAPNTQITIVSKQENLNITHSFRNIQIQHIKEDSADKNVLEKLLETGNNNILILSDGTLDSEAADAKALLQLIYLWDIARKKGYPYNITSEMQHTTNQRLAAQAHVDDFVIGSNIINLLMTQIAENRELTALFEDILDEDGSELYMKPIYEYVTCNTPVDFYTVTESAARKGHIAIGYKTRENGELKIITNPAKSEPITFNENDSLIVVAED